jgi:hypothetical protein
MKNQKKAPDTNKRKHVSDYQASKMTAKTEIPATSKPKKEKK